MIHRYRGEYADLQFSDQAVVDRWTELTKAFAVDAARQAFDNPARDHLKTVIVAPTAMAVRTREQDTGHDVVAFLSLIEQQVAPYARKYLHYGLTSSDIVDNAMMLGIHRFNHKIRTDVLPDLMTELHRISDDYGGDARLGRTHGQFAEPSSLDHRIGVWWNVLNRMLADPGLGRGPHVKTPGPVGNSRFRPTVNIREAVSPVAVLHPSTQVIPRDLLIQWASLMLRLATTCEDIAMELRLSARAEVAEFMEGGANHRVGSSSMPHKRNPIGAEQISGMARLARGYFSMIAESAVLHNDRDISNSSVERIAVPDMAHIVEHMLRRTALLLAEGQWDIERMGQNLAANLPEATSTWMQTLLQKHGNLGPVKAGRVFREAVTEYRSDQWATALFRWLNTNVGGDEALAFKQEYASMVRDHLNMI